MSRKGSGGQGRLATELFFLGSPPWPACPPGRAPPTLKVVTGWVAPIGVGHGRAVPAGGHRARSVMARVPTSRGAVSCSCRHVRSVAFPVREQEPAALLTHTRHGDRRAQQRDRPAGAAGTGLASRPVARG